MENKCEYSKDFLISEFWRWVNNHNGKIPKRDDMKASDGYPSGYQYSKIFKIKKWSDILSKFGIESNKNTKWSLEEIKFLKENWFELSDEDIAIKLKRTKESTRSKRTELGLFRQSQKQPWQQWEIQYLKENFFDAPQEEIENKLSHRNWEGIRSYATKFLKLQRGRFASELTVDSHIDINQISDRPKRNKKEWDIEEDNYISSNWMSMSDLEIAQHLDRGEYAVSKRRQVLGYHKYIKPKSSNKTNNKKIVLLSKDKKMRMCKHCKTWYLNTADYFHRDKNGLRTLCIECEKQKQKVDRFKRGAIINDIKTIMLEKNLSYCSCCKEWKNLDQFWISENTNEIHRYCKSCCKENYIKSYYGFDNLESYLDHFSNLLDLNNEKCDSIPEKIITNWLITNDINYDKHPKYSDYVDLDNSNRLLDWVVFVDDKKYLVEYFGLWDTKSNSERCINYVIKAKKKIKDLYKAGLINQCIFIFPWDIKNKSLDEIFKPLFN